MVFPLFMVQPERLNFLEFSRSDAANQLRKIKSSFQFQFLCATFCALCASVVDPSNGCSPQRRKVLTTEGQRTQRTHRDQYTQDKTKDGLECPSFISLSLGNYKRFEPGNYATVISCDR